MLNEEKGAKEKVLQEIMDLMEAKQGGSIKDLKKSAAPDPETPAMEVEEHATGEEAMDEPSEDEKAKIAELYAKWCAK